MIDDWGSTSNPGPCRRTCQHLRGLCAALLGIAAGCSAQRIPPPKPALPAIVFVEPCDPSATIGMTEDGVARLKARDEAWRTHVDVLEAIIRNGN